LNGVTHATPFHDQNERVRLSYGIPGRCHVACKEKNIKLATLIRRRNLFSGRWKIHRSSGHASMVVIGALQKVVSCALHCCTQPTTGHVGSHAGVCRPTSSTRSAKRKCVVHQHGKTALFLARRKATGN